MRTVLYLIAAMLIISPFAAYTQNTDSLVNKLDSLKKQTDTTGQTNLTDASFYNERTKMNGKVFGILLLDDFKQQAMSPLDINKRGWLLGAGLVAGTVALSFVDKPIQQWAVGLRKKNANLGSYSKTVSDIGGVYEVATFATIATYGFVFKNPKLRTTTALATQAYITSTFWSTVFKTLSGRERPNQLDLVSTTSQSNSSFHGPFYKLPSGNSAFPSGHTTLAFAAARVYAMEYKHIPAIPIIAYSVAGLIGFSRVIENRHWTTDVFTGALLGFACGTQVVNNYHRYARLIRTGGQKKKKRGDLSFNLQYAPEAGLQPGLVYKFR